jgi:hypothetical protein
MGGTKDAYTTVSTGLSCWVQPAKNSEIQEYSQRTISVSHKVYFISDPAVDERHVLVIGGETYLVKSKSHPDASAGLGIVYKIMTELKR